MATWQVTISGKGIKRVGIEALAKALTTKYGEGATVIVRDASPPESRADRFAAAISQVGDAKSEIEALRNELQEWRDGMPENLQDGSKATELDDAISELDDVVSRCEDVEGADVTFPGMF